MRLRDMPIQKKLMTALLATSGAVLLITCVSFLVYEVITLRATMLQGYSTRAEIIAANSTAALAFQNEIDAAEVLGALRRDPRTVAACLYDEKGRILASYPPEAPEGIFPAPLGTSGFRDGHLEVFCPVVQEGRTLGTVFLRSDLSALTQRYAAFAWLSLAVITGSIVVAFLISRKIQAQISSPILALAGTARAISAGGDFSVRAEKLSEDELGSLTDAFNRMLEALAERTRLLDMVMQSMSEGVVVADRTGKMVYFNKSAEKIVGSGISKNPSSEWAKEYGVFREDKVTPFPERELPLVRAFKGESTDGTIQFLRNGSYPDGVFISVNARPLKDERGTLSGGLVVIRDMTAQLKAEADLRASETNYREIFEKINDALYIHEVGTGRILDVNQRTCELVECSREDLLQGDPKAFITGEAGYTLEDAVHWIRKAGDEGPQLFEWKAKTKKGKRIWVEVSLKRTILAGQTRILGVVRDITERKKLEEALKTQSFITSVLENLPNMVFVKDAKDLRFVMFNKAGEELLGVPRQDMIGKNDHDFFPKEQADFFTSKDRKVLESGKLLDIPEETLPTKHKGPRTLHTKKIPVLGSDGKPQFLLGISEDITEQKRQEELRIYTRALETSNKELQDFVFVASHDLQEPLRKVQAFGNFLKEELGQGITAAAADYLQRMQEAAFRMGRLIEDLLQLTRVTTRAKPFERTSLEQVLKEVLGDLEVRLKETGGKVLAKGLVDLDADPTQMRQLLQNLLGNALKFHKPGEAPVVEVQGEVQGDSLRLRVKDNGIGFDPKYNQKIFDIFQRLNGQEYEGTGIGLAVCRKVAERHGGRITASSRPGQGAEFEVVLPLRQDRKEGKDGA